MKNRILSALGLGKKTPVGESPLIPAHGEFPAGARIGVLCVANTNWEIIHHPQQKLFSFRHLDDKDAKGPVYQLEEGHIAEIVVEKGRILHPKRVEAVIAGRWLDGLEPGTFFSATDRPEGVSDALLKSGKASFDQYTMTHTEMISYLTGASAPLLRDYAAPPEPEAKDVPPNG